LTEQDISELAAKQKEILREYNELVKPGGRLVYATCTISREENEEVVGAFLEENEEFCLVPVAEVNLELFSKFMTEEGFFRSLPHVHGTDGFFGAVMRRK
jgi:16S rRNA (cytosine967-C5)-methyltransferase